MRVVRLQQLVDIDVLGAVVASIGEIGPLCQDLRTVVAQSVDALDDQYISSPHLPDQP